MGTNPDGSDSHGVPIQGAENWNICMVVAIVSEKEKPVGSTEGMERSRLTSPFYQSWTEGADTDLEDALQAIDTKDIERLGKVMESSTFKMHATMHTSVPPLLYWQPNTVACLHAVFELRAHGLGAWTTMDAGPQVKVLCMASDASKVAKALEPHAQQVHVLRPGPGARLVAS
jgi:diphosphomevalonate decarboxylase